MHDEIFKNKRKINLRRSKTRIHPDIDFMTVVIPDKEKREQHWYKPVNLALKGMA